MGTYTELHLNVRFSRHTPEQVIHTLSWMLSEGPMPLAMPDHPLFETDRFAGMLRSGSAYFGNATPSAMHKELDTGEHVLSVHTSFKNYNDEIDKFIDWISPWVDDDFLGYFRQEGIREPTLVYIK